MVDCPDLIAQVADTEAHPVMVADLVALLCFDSHIAEVEYTHSDPVQVDRMASAADSEETVVVAEHISYCSADPPPPRLDL